jgi:hypothetical protein
MVKGATLAIGTRDVTHLFGQRLESVNQQSRQYGRKNSHNFALFIHCIKEKNCQKSADIEA